MNDRSGDCLEFMTVHDCGRKCRHRDAQSYGKTRRIGLKRKNGLRNRHGKYSVNIGDLMVLRYLSGMKIRNRLSLFDRSGKRFDEHRRIRDDVLMLQVRHYDELANKSHLREHTVTD